LVLYDVINGSRKGGRYKNIKSGFKYWGMTFVKVDLFDLFKGNLKKYENFLNFYLSN
jgi:hypothetical protein